MYSVFTLWSFVNTDQACKKIEVKEQDVNTLPMHSKYYMNSSLTKQSVSISVCIEKP